jgi:hypothetical protein
MQIYRDQAARIGQQQAQARVRHWQGLADAALPAERRSDPRARLQVLARAVARAQGPQAAVLGVDVLQTAQWLDLALQRGTAWREARALALLHGAAALGALWFLDDRLLPAAQQLPLKATLEDTVVQLLAQPQGLRFKQAADRERALRPGLRLAWQQVLVQDLSPNAAHTLASAAFAAPPAQEAEADAPPEPEADAEDTGPPPAQAAFMAHERRLQAQAGLQDGALAAWCLAADLVLGLGRSVRMMSLAPADVPARLAWLKETLHALAR